MNLPDWMGPCYLTSSLSGCLALYILSKLNHKVDYICRFMFLYLGFSFVSIFIILASLPRGRNIKNGPPAAKMMMSLNYWLGLTWSVEGTEHLSKDGGAVVLMNHQSSVDVMPMLEIWAHLKTGAAVSKKSLLYVPMFGIASWLIGTVFVDRASKNAKNSINEAGADAAKNKLKLFFYPEGTRNTAKSLTLLPFKKGAFHVALDANLPIIPVIVKEYDHVDSKKMMFRPGHTVIRALPQIDTTQYTKETINELVELTRTRMLETLQELGQKKAE